MRFDSIPSILLLSLVTKAQKENICGNGREARNVAAYDRLSIPLTVKDNISGFGSNSGYIG